VTRGTKLVVYGMKQGTYFVGDNAEVFQVLRISVEGCTGNATRLFLDIAHLLLG
jgi:hypothetical protein